MVGAVRVGGIAVAHEGSGSSMQSPGWAADGGKYWSSGRGGPVRAAGQRRRLVSFRRNRPSRLVFQALKVEETDVSTSTLFRSGARGSLITAGGGGPASDRVMAW